MQYAEFLFDVNAYKQITKKEYQYLEDIYGKEEVKEFFEMYLTDETIDEQEKENKTKFYLTKFINKNNLDYYSENHLKNYLKDISISKRYI